MPNGKVDEGEIALIIGEGGLKNAVRSAWLLPFQAWVSSGTSRISETRNSVNSRISARKKSTNHQSLLITADEILQ